MTDIVEIKRRLADRAQSVAEHLLPNGRKIASEWRVGSVAGEKGQSLGVHLGGHKAGVWSDFSTGDGGDLLDLWSAARGVKLAVAIDEAREWLGISRPKPHRDPKPNYARPPKPNCTVPKGRVRDYLTVERNIPGHVLDLFKVGEQGDEIVFPFLLPDGVLALAKVRKAEAGASPRPTAANCEPVLFGWQAVADNARELVITEGEIDALSWTAYGHTAVSVPFGGGKGGKQKWIENEFDRLARFEKIYISTDMDGPGEEAAEEIAGRLGRHRCYRVKLPRKDANECLVAGVAAEAMTKALLEADNLDPDGLRQPSDFADKVIHLFWPAAEDHVGYTMPHGRLSEKLHFRPGEVTLWSGASGDGKSQIISDCIPHWVKLGSRICLSSLEMSGEQSMRRMLKQLYGVDRPTARAISTGLAWLDQGLLVYDKIGKAGIEGLLDIFSYARAKYGCDQFVIDSLMRLGVAQDDYNGLEKLVFQIVDWTIANRVHMHLVAHARKGDKDRGSPGTEDIKGPMEIGANAFNILSVWRNRKLDDHIKAEKDDARRAELAQKPTVIVNVAKQRNGDFEGKVGLWFDQESYRYHATSDRTFWDRQYVPRDDQAA